MATINFYVAPKRYLRARADDTMPLPDKLLRVLTTHVEPSGRFGENIADSFYNKTPELGEIFSVGMPAPILRGHSARKGTASKFRGRLSKIFPELEKVSDKALDRVIKDMRDREG